MRSALLLLVVLALAGCKDFENDAQRGYSLAPGFTTKAAFTTADVRIITQRTRPVTNTEVVCTEPSPDVAKALSTAVAAAGQGGNGTITAGLGFGAASAEAAAELAGRSTALLGLRDALFQACQAYANGAIGGDAYALILSRYGQLMTTLFLAQDITGAAGTKGGTAFESPPINLSVSGSGNSVVGQQATKTGDSTTKNGTDSTDKGNSGGTSKTTTTTDNSGTTKTTTNTTPDKSTDTGGGGSGGGNNAAQAAALAIARMNEDYMNLDYNLPHMLAVACLNQYDTTNNNFLMKYGSANTDIISNHWLTPLCHNLWYILNTKGLADLAKVDAGLVKAGVLRSPIDPAAAAAGGKQTPAAKNAAASQKPRPAHANPGPARPGPAQPGPPQPGPPQPGPPQAGPPQAGPAQPGPAQPEPVAPGPVHQRPGHQPADQRQ